MFRLLLALVSVGVALGKGPAPTPPTAAPPAASPPAPLRCGEIPNDVYKCLGNPKIIKPDVSSKCDRSTSECDRIRCIFKGSGWLKDDKVDKQAVSAYFTKFASDNPDWTEATVFVKEQCLGKNLPPQGVLLECPAYDTMHCILTGFLRSAKPTQWTSTPKCEQSKQFAAACPNCPGDCFATSIPIGSCNACLNWPKKP